MDRGGQADRQAKDIEEERVSQSGEQSLCEGLEAEKHREAETRDAGPECQARQDLQKPGPI
jgi:hypothetical protein